MLENSPRILRNWSSFALPRSIWDNSLDWDLFARKKKLAKCAQKNLFNTYSWHTSPLYPELENTLHRSIIRKWTFHNALWLNGATRPLDESEHVTYSRYCDHRHHNPAPSGVSCWIWPIYWLKYRGTSYGRMDAYEAVSVWTCKIWWLLAPFLVWLVEYQ